MKNNGPQIISSFNSCTYHNTGNISLDNALSKIDNLNLLIADLKTENEYLKKMPQCYLVADSKNNIPIINIYKEDNPNNDEPLKFYVDDDLVNLIREILDYIGVKYDYKEY